MNWLEEEPNEFNPLYYYIAQLTCAVVRANAEKGSKASRCSTENFIINFKWKENKPVPEELHDFDEDEEEAEDISVEERYERLPPEVQARVREQKMNWMIMKKSAQIFHREGPVKGKESKGRAWKVKDMKHDGS